MTEHQYQNNKNHHSFLNEVSSPSKSLDLFSYFYVFLFSRNPLNFLSFLLWIDPRFVVIV